MVIVGVGVDAVEIQELARLLRDTSGAFAKKAFSAAELAYAGWDPGTLVARRPEILAAAFAAKEAVLKALAPALGDKSFDICLVETCHRDDGSPYIRLDGPVAPALRAAGATAVHLSVTHEGPLAVAFVIAEG